MSDDDKKNLQTDEAGEETTENDSEEKNGDNLSEESNEFFKELEELEKIREERKEKSKKKLEKIIQEREKWKSEKKEGKESRTVMIGGKLTVLKTKDYTHKFKVFRHNRVNDFQNKGSARIEKALHKVHGMALKKKLDFLEALKAYNPTKSVLKKKDFDEFTRRFKSKRFVGNNFKKVKKEGIDIKSLRKQFGKRDIDKIRRGITGQEDPYKYKSKSSDLKNTARK